jgi:hypothetical protein
MFFIRFQIERKSMKLHTTGIATILIASGLVSGAAHAALQGRDLNGSAGSFEAYYDTGLDITWLADANYAKTSGYDADGLMTWSQANAWAAQLDINGYANWRLPTVEPINGASFNYSYSTNGSSDVGYNITSPNSELAYMFYVNLGNPGYFTPAGEVSSCYVGFPNATNTCLDSVGPFSNLQPGVYWSATEYAPYPSLAWFFFMYDGNQGSGYGDYYAWAVSPGDVAAVPEADTWGMLLAGLTLVGAATRLRRVRFGKSSA